MVVEKVYSSLPISKSKVEKVVFDGKSGGKYIEKNNNDERQMA